MNIAELTQIFENLGAPNPSEWATSQMTEGIPQLARFLFLKGCWDSVSDSIDGDWIEARLNSVPSTGNKPFDGMTHAIRRMLQCGVSRDDLTELVRCAKVEMMHDILYQMDDSEIVAGNKRYVNWCLMLLDSEENPKVPISGLHESVLETDPSGKEMRPF